MREIKHELAFAKQRINILQGRKVRVRVNRGRNRFVNYSGSIRDIYPAVFTFETDEGLLTFSYSDLLTKSLRIYPS